MPGSARFRRTLVRLWELRCSAADQGLPALLRTYRATGRADEAQKLATRYLASLRGPPPEEEDDPHMRALDLAALAANEGNKDEAVAALRTAFKLAHLVWGFDPQAAVVSQPGGPPRLRGSAGRATAPDR